MEAGSVWVIVLSAKPRCENGEPGGGSVVPGLVFGSKICRAKGASRGRSVFHISPVGGNDAGMGGEVEWWLG